jgi:hypothetical protein
MRVRTRASEIRPPRDLEGVAASFLRRHHRTLDLPIPIEEIVEFDLGLNIIPLPNLYRDFQIESWLSHDTQAIYVDLRQCEEMETRYRFSLAHEVGHLLLHADLYRGSRLDSFADWLKFQEELDPVLRDSLEWQARSLAGRILVPAEPLVAQAQSMLERARRRLPRQVSLEALYGSISIPLSGLFRVHEEVVRIRLSGDGLGQRLRLK